MSVTDPYDLLPYEAGSDYRIRPEHLAMTSWLHGGPLPKVAGFRLLDLGCGTASSLLPLAFYDPTGDFVGIDSSRTQIDSARDVAAELELDNVRLLWGDANELDPKTGPFDYVLLHAVFSWVHEDVRHRLLDLARDSLTADGLLLVSYNTYPGWKIRETVRDTLLLRHSGDDPPETRIAGAKKLAETLYHICPERPHPYYGLLRQELARVFRGQDFYVLHEYLAPHNTAYYFRDFCALAESHGLSYIADAQFNHPAGHTPPEIGEALAAKGNDPMAVEQEVDFLLYRQFRAAIMCRKDASRRAPPGPADIKGLSVATNLRPVQEEPDLGTDKPVTFVRIDDSGLEYEFEDPGIKAALGSLAEHTPRGRPVDEIIARADALLVSSGAGGLRALSPEEWHERFLGLHLRGMVEMRLHEPPLSRGTVDRADKIPHALAAVEARLRPHLTTPFFTAFYPERETRDWLTGAGNRPPPATLAKMEKWGLLR